MNLRFDYYPCWYYRNPKIGFYSVNLHFPFLLINSSEDVTSFNFNAWSDCWFYKSKVSFTFSLNILGFGFKFHHRSKEYEYGIYGIMKK